MQQKSLVLTLVSLLVVPALALSACSDSDDDDGDVPSPTQQADGGGGSPVGPALLDQPEPAQPIIASVTEPVSNTVDITISDASFVNNNIGIPLGEAITIRVTSGDPLTHNLRIAGLDGEYNTEDDAVTDPESIGPGETAELTFAPPVAGTYTFRCDFHPASMGGVITVQ